MELINSQSTRYILLVEIGLFLLQIASQFHFNDSACQGEPFFSCTIWLLKGFEVIKMIAAQVIIN